jgi:hypothetical protein
MNCIFCIAKVGVAEYAAHSASALPKSTHFTIIMATTTTMHAMDDWLLRLAECSNDEDEDDIIEEMVVREYVLQLAAEEQIEQAVAPLQREEKKEMFPRRDFAEEKMKRLLRGHPDLLHQATRLTHHQFEGLVQWLREKAYL